MKRCLYCYENITKSNSGESGFHYGCSRKFFHEPLPPEFPYTLDDIAKLAAKIVKNRFAITGVQPKLSLKIAKSIKDKSRNKNAGLLSKELKIPSRLTILGVPGNYILKPPSDEYPDLPEIEHLSMKLAELSNISTVPNTLIFMKDGTRTYLTRRIDRVNGKNGIVKIHMEDMCQLTNRMTEDKYKGSHEKIARTIKEFSVNPLLDVINFYEMVLFSFLTGNADMHLKNFSLIKDPRFKGNRTGYILSPAYDMVSTALVINDDEELALTLNGKKRKITRNDFETALTTIGVHEKSIENIFKKFETLAPIWSKCIRKSFLPSKLKTLLTSIIHARMDAMYLES
ncbi:MAG: HipA domain-containing protein [Leptospirales bacterium]